MRITKWFLLHQWNEMKRSSIWQKNLVLNIVIGFFLLLMLLYILLLGLFIDKILAELFPDINPVEVFNGILIYYLGIELFLRFIIQSLPTLNIETYLHLPIKKSSILHFVVSKSLVAIGNYLPLLIIIPFAYKVIAPVHSVGIVWAYIVFVFLFVINNNFLATYLKRHLVSKPYIVGIFALLILLLGLLDYFNVYSLSGISAHFFGIVLTNPLIILVPTGLVVISYSLNYFFLKTRLYPEEVILHKKRKTDSLENIKYLKSLGLTGEMILLELKLLWRHKRTKSVLYLSPIFLGYGFFFYPQDIYHSNLIFLIFVGIFITGGMMLSYVNYCFGYESNYFDGILAKYTDFERYIRVKYFLAIFISTVCYILTIPYVYFGLDILIINTVTWLYNIGLLTFVLLYFATYSKKRMDLSRGAAFNYQGVGAMHWLSMLPAFLLPILIYLPFSLFNAKYAGLIVIGAFGLFGLLFYKSILGIVQKQFESRRYSMAEGFRE